MADADSEMPDKFEQGGIDVISPQVAPSTIESSKEISVAVAIPATGPNVPPVLPSTVVNSQHSHNSYNSTNLPDQVTRSDALRQAARAYPLSTDRILRDYDAREVSKTDKPAVFGWVALAGAAISAIGALGPWAVVNAGFLSINVNGMNGDGQITIFLSVIAAILLLLRLTSKAKGWTVLVSFLLLGIVAVIGIADYNQIGNLVDNNENADVQALVQTGWGIQSLLFGSILGCVMVALHWFRREINEQ